MRIPIILPSATFQKVLRREVGLNEYLGLDPAELAAAAALGANLHEQGRTADARVIFEGLIALDPFLYLGYAGIGAIDLIEEELEPALRNLARAAELNPDDASVQTNLGEALLQCGEFARAGECFERALSLDPRGDDAGANRARVIIQGLLHAMDRARGAASR